MAIGTVKWFDSAKGYGFIQPDNDVEEIIVRSGVVERSGLRGLRPGQRLTFEIVEERRSRRVYADKLELAGG